MTHPHPQMQAILQRQQAAPLTAPEGLPIGQARANFLQANTAWNANLPHLSSQWHRVGEIDCQFLVPETRKRALIVFVHGGGWTFGSPATHERFARLLAVLTGAAVLVPDYRLAPEHPAPAAIEDICAVLADRATLAALDAPADVALILCGDSAGANIALATALTRPARSIAMLSLLYGCFAPVFDTASHRRNGGGQYGLSTARMQWYWNNWLGAQADARAAPLNGDLQGLPRCHLLAAALDPLCDDSFLLAERLTEAGVPFRLDVVPGVVHGFLQMTQELAPAMEATRAIAQEIATAF